MIRNLILKILGLPTSKTIIFIFHLPRIIGAKRHSTYILLRTEGENEFSMEGVGQRNMAHGMEKVSAGRNRAMEVCRRSLNFPLSVMGIHWRLFLLF